VSRNARSFSCSFAFCVAKPELIEIFGCNLLDDETHAMLCRIGAACAQAKPFECVGETQRKRRRDDPIRRSPDFGGDG